MEINPANRPPTGSTEGVKQTHVEKAPPTMPKGMEGLRPSAQTSEGVKMSEKSIKQEGVVENAKLNTASKRVLSEGAHKLKGAKPYEGGNDSLDSLAELVHRELDKTVKGDKVKESKGLKGRMQQVSQENICSDALAVFAKDAKERIASAAA